LTYDLVSLLRDCYLTLPPEQVTVWLFQHYDHLQQLGWAVGSFAQFQQWFDWMGLQRHLKAIGIFSRLWLRDGKPGYLKDIPRTLDYVVHVLASYPDFAEFHAYVINTARPGYQQWCPEQERR
jgi:aminoglycoside/choline kinase family phosphotransferase